MCVYRARRGLGTLPDLVRPPMKYIRDASKGHGALAVVNFPADYMHRYYMHN